MPTAKSAKNDHTLVKTIITNHVCIIQVATIYSAIFDMVIIYNTAGLQEIYNLLTVLAGRNFFHPCLREYEASFFIQIKYFPKYFAKWHEINRDE